MTVHVSDDVERIIRLHLRSGRFSSESDVIDAALGLLNGCATEPAAKKPATEEEFKQQLLEAGLMTGLPIPIDFATSRDFQPVQIDGEPLSETIIRERR